MGEIADDIVDGFCCSDCGVYFDESHGHPVLCKSCYDYWKSYGIKDTGNVKFKPDLPKAYIKELWHVNHDDVLY